MEITKVGSKASQTTTLLPEANFGEVNYRVKNLPNWVTSHLADHISDLKTNNEKNKIQTSIDEARKRYKILRSK